MKNPGNSDGVNERDSLRYAGAAAKVLGELGDLPRARVLAMLGGLGLGDEQARDAVEQGRDFYARQRDTVTSAIERGREAFQQAREEGRNA